jgi:epoxyqueuosine reductase
LVNAPETDALRTALVEQARLEGFVAVGIAPAEPDALRGERLQRYLDEGRHGSMEWIARRVAERASPQGLWPEAKSVIALGMSYAPAADPLALAGVRDRARISVYAQGRDYHDTVKKALKRLARWLVAQAPGEQVKVFVDTAPVMEKPLGAAAGLGWQGKHTNLVSREHGSWLFLGAIYTTIDFAPDEPHADRCGTCTACQDACPTRAFPSPYQIDARRCISYLTIEHAGPIPVEFRAAMGNRIYGCDDCLAVCPWNSFASAAAANKAFLPRAELAAPRLAELLALDDAGFRALFSGSPVKRIGRNRFVRNCLIAAGNSGDRSLEATVVSLLADADPVVAEAARWALDQLSASAV